LRPDGRHIAEFADAGDAFADFVRPEFEFVEIDHFTALAEAALHEHAGESFFAFERSGEFDVPEIRARLEEMDGVKVAFGFLVDFSDDASVGDFGLIAIELALESEFLIGEKFFVEPEDTAIAADEKGLRHLFDENAARAEPGDFDGHAKSDTVALAHGFCASGGHVKDKDGLKSSVTRGN
jgi:hypothetical protein